jgi:hypothetical protein
LLRQRSFSACREPSRNRNLRHPAWHAPPCNGGAAVGRRRY